MLGISTASLFTRLFTEDALPVVRDFGSEAAEVFMATFREYRAEYGRLFAERKGDMPIHSIHSLNQHFEPDLFNPSPRTREDCEQVLRSFLANGQMMGAKYYTFHGRPRLKPGAYPIDWPSFGKRLEEINGICQENGITLCYENVDWTLYNYCGFFRSLTPYAPSVKATLDVKQARLSGVDVYELLDEMGDRLVTVHLSDHDQNGKMCAPGKGLFDFERLFRSFKQRGFTGACLIELYPSDYKQIAELKESLDYLKSIRDRIYQD